ncbi:YwdI family protein [Siminovitchia sp. FSL H7-0308]|uniref:Phytoene/squalene synthetase n=1 Tax=Siminovitchia thermophila TaxID=1245522 RepID=A0ABS2R457_9BACI|nr:YwdI family protein [Siminovitchia thermophila]MBM7714430.1 phytoene/squalene synthetase [Siminovitchia thermophila]ONK25028.1 hypothetical protein BLX87_02340 [Bacillus sp. VT-16-64]
MYVTYKAFIDKMEQELSKAKQAESAKEIRSRMSAVKALAELVLEAGGQEVSQEQKCQQVSPQPMNDLGAKVLEDEEANGESIFDF